MSSYDDFKNAFVSRNASFRITKDRPVHDLREFMTHQETLNLDVVTYGYHPFRNETTVIVEGELRFPRFRTAAFEIDITGLTIEEATARAIAELDRLIAEEKD